MDGKAQAPVLRPFGTLHLRHNCSNQLMIALTDPHSPFQSMFLANQEEQSHRQNAITPGGSVMHNKNIPSEGAVHEAAAIPRDQAVTMLRGY